MARSDLGTGGVGRRSSDNGAVCYNPGLGCESRAAACVQGAKRAEVNGVKRIWLIVVVLMAAVAAIGVIRRSQRGAAAEALTSVRMSRQVMGTLAAIEAVGRPGQQESLRKAVEAAYAAVDRVEALMSQYKEDSLVSQINREAYNQPVPLDAWTLEVLEQSKRYWDLSGGAFDPTCGPLIELWKRCGKEDRLPSEEELAEAKARTGFEKVAIDTAVQPATIRFAAPGMRIDLGGIAKGYSIDLAIGALRESGCAGGLVDIGGDIRSFGRPADDEQWNVVVQNPFEQGQLLVLGLNDGSVCTSGNYHRFAVIRGHRYSHIIDPRSGYPAEATPSVTIVGPEATGTDALATAVSVLGAKEGLEVIRRLTGYEAMVVVGTPESFEMARTGGFGRYVERQTDNNGNGSG